jgi:hypothetical protein
MKCDNCNAYNARVIKLHDGEERHLLCPRCLKILKTLDEAFVNTMVDEQTSSGHNSF